MSIYGPESHDNGTVDLPEYAITPFINQRIKQSKQKPIVTVWAEEKGNFKCGAFEWSFGNVLC